MKLLQMVAFLAVAIGTEAEPIDNRWLRGKLHTASLEIGDGSYGYGNWGPAAYIPLSTGVASSTSPSSDITNSIDASPVTASVAPSPCILPSTFGGSSAVASTMANATEVAPVATSAASGPHSLRMATQSSAPLSNVLPNLTEVSPMTTSMLGSYVSHPNSIATTGPNSTEASPVTASSTSKEVVVLQSSVFHTVTSAFPDWSDSVPTSTIPTTSAGWDLGIGSAPVVTPSLPASAANTIGCFSAYKGCFYNGTLVSPTSPSSFPSAGSSTEVISIFSSDLLFWSSSPTVASSESSDSSPMSPSPTSNWCPSYTSSSALPIVTTPSSTVNNSTNESISSVQSSALRPHPSDYGIQMCPRSSKLSNITLDLSTTAGPVAAFSSAIATLLHGSNCTKIDNINSSSALTFTVTLPTEAEAIFPSSSMALAPLSSHQPYLWKGSAFSTPLSSTGVSPVDASSSVGTTLSTITSAAAMRTSYGIRGIYGTGS